jgi:hypothetical protein
MSDPARPADLPDHITPGILANNAMFVQNLHQALGYEGTKLRSFPAEIGFIIKQEAWRAWVDNQGQWHGEGFGPDADFRNFLRRKWPKGLGMEIGLVERWLEGTGEPWELYVKACGGRHGGNRNPTGINQHTMVKPDHVQLDREAEVKPDNVRDDLTPKRDRSNELPGGNSRMAAIRRLMKETEAGTIDPSILGRVKAGKLTPNGAMIEAGLKRRTLTIPDDPEVAAAALARHFKGYRLDKLVEVLRALQREALYESIGLRRREDNSWAWGAATAEPSSPPPPPADL